MLQTIKKQICLQKSDWLLGAGCELGMWLMGIAFMLVMQRSDPEDTYVLLGTIFAIIGSAGVATFIMLYGLGINFNTQISLGNRRTPGVLPVKRTMKNNNFFSVSLLTGWRYFYAAFNVSS